MDRRDIGRAGLGTLALLLTGRAGAAETKVHRVAIQVDTDDRHVQATALGNAHNFAAHYRDRGEASQIEIVVFGPGYSMVRADLSMMKGEIEALQKDLGPSLRVAACRNTRNALAASEGRKPQDIPLLPGVTETPSGIVRVAELQEQGWPYVRP